MMKTMYFSKFNISFNSFFVQKYIIYIRIGTQIGTRDTLTKTHITNNKRREINLIRVYVGDSKSPATLPRIGASDRHFTGRVRPHKPSFLQKFLLNS